MRRFLLLLAATPLLAQHYSEPYYPHHNFSAALGAERPRGDLGGPFQDAPVFSFGYGYRFYRYFQADIGLDVGIGAAQIKDYLITGIGDFRIRDYQFFVPFGGRAIIPLWNGRFQFAGGGGGAKLHYSERVSQPSTYFRVDCPVCTSRGGWGYYALLNASFALDHGQHFRFGATTKVYRGHTDGEPLGAIPGIRTKDRWVNLFAEFNVGF
jgi:hypothetical protein